MHLVDADRSAVPPGPPAVTPSSPSSTWTVLPPANRQRRLVAALFDYGAFFAACALLTTLQFAVRDGLGGTPDADRFGRDLATTIFFGLVVFQVLLLVRTGQTLGKRLAGIRIVRAADGGRVGFLDGFVVRTIAHFFLCLVPVYLVADLAMACFGRGRTLHDRISGTVVVDVPAAAPRPAETVAARYGLSA